MKRHCCQVGVSTRLLLDELQAVLVAQEFVYKPQLNTATKEKRVKAFDLNSLYYEPGQKSYMREPIAYQVLQ